MNGNAVSFLPLGRRPTRPLAGGGGGIFISTGWTVKARRSSSVYVRKLGKGGVAVEMLPLLEAEAKERQGTRTDITQIIAEGSKGEA